MESQTFNLSFKTIFSFFLVCLSLSGEIIIWGHYYEFNIVWLCLQSFLSTILFFFCSLLQSQQLYFIGALIYIYNDGFFILAIRESNDLTISMFTANLMCIFAPFFGLFIFPYETMKFKRLIKNKLLYTLIVFGCLMGIVSFK
eukprot:TRINITY_DN1395_c0_g1_i1.p1 TRINITY_DN1395_c0_g1~~TRINITY_DN1395_c0_g1_i1.p1  ORF type:complete len:143 (-),score=18.20 TRINITY_DN1395_c0_g1_i1:22-450(-)